MIYNPLQISGSCFCPGCRQTSDFIIVDEGLISQHHVFVPLTVCCQCAPTFLHNTSQLISFNDAKRIYELELRQSIH